MVYLENDLWDPVPPAPPVCLATGTQGYLTARQYEEQMLGTTSGAIRALIATIDAHPELYANVRRKRRRDEAGLVTGTVDSLRHHLRQVMNRYYGTADEEGASLPSETLEEVTRVKKEIMDVFLYSLDNRHRSTQLLGHVQQRVEQRAERRYTADQEPMAARQAVEDSESKSAEKPKKRRLAASTSAANPPSSKTTKNSPQKRKGRERSSSKKSERSPSSGTNGEHTPALLAPNAKAAKPSSLQVGTTPSEAPESAKTPKVRSKLVAQMSTVGPISLADRLDRGTEQVLLEPCGLSKDAIPPPPPPLPDTVDLVSSSNGSIDKRLPTPMLEKLGRRVSSAHIPVIKPGSGQLPKSPLIEAHPRATLVAIGESGNTSPTQISGPTTGQPGLLAAIRENGHTAWDNVMVTPRTKRVTEREEDASAGNGMFNMKFNTKMLKVYNQTHTPAKSPHDAEWDDDS